MVPNAAVFNDSSPQEDVFSPLLWNLIMGKVLQSMDLQPVHAHTYTNDIVLLSQGCDLRALKIFIIAYLALAGQ